MVLARYQSPDPVNVSRPPKGLAVDADNKIHFFAVVNSADRYDLQLFAPRKLSSTLD